MIECCYTFITILLKWKLILLKEDLSAARLLTTTCIFVRNGLLVLFDFNFRRCLKINSYLIFNNYDFESRVVLSVLRRVLLLALFFSIFVLWDRVSLYSSSWFQNHILVLAASILGSEAVPLQAAQFNRFLNDNPEYFWINRVVYP